MHSVIYYKQVWKIKNILVGKERKEKKTPFPKMERKYYIQ